MFIRTSQQQRAQLEELEKLPTLTNQPATRSFSPLPRQPLPEGTPWWDYLPAICNCGSPHHPAVDLEVATQEENLWELHKADPDPTGVGRCPYARIGQTCPSHPTGDQLPDFDGLETGEFRSQTLPEQARRIGPTWDGRTPQETRSRPSKVQLKRDLIRALSG